MSQTTLNERSAQLDSYIENQVKKTSSQVKMVDLFTSSMILFCGFLGGLFLLAIVDAWIVEFGTVARWIALIAMIGGAVAFFALNIFPLLIRKINPVYAAKVVESAQPDLNNSLINYLLLRKQDTKVSRRVVDIVGSQAAQGISGVPLENTVDKSQTIKVSLILAVLVISMAGYKIWSPKDPFQTFARILAPSSEISKPARVQISNVQPGDKEVFFGQPVEVIAEITGKFDPAEARVEYTTQDGQIVNGILRMEETEKRNQFRCLLKTNDRGLDQAVTYRVLAGDAISKDYYISVKMTPILTVESITYTPPEYTERPQQTVAGVTAITALEGTRVEIQALANADIKNAYVELLKEAKDGSGFLVTNTVAMEHDEPRRAVGGFKAQMNPRRTAQRYTHYRLQLETTDGGKSTADGVYPLKVIADEAPEIEVVNPAQTTLTVPANSRIKFDLQAIDPDFKLTEIQVAGDFNGFRKFDGQLKFEGQDPSGQVTTSFEFWPKKYDLRADDSLLLAFAALDNRHSVLSNQPDPNMTVTPTIEIKIVDPIKNPPKEQPPKSEQNKDEKGDEGQPENDQNNNDEGKEDQNKDGSEKGDQGEENKDQKSDQQDNNKSGNEDREQKEKDENADNTDSGERGEDDRNMKNDQDGGQRSGDKDNPNEQSPQDDNRNEKGSDSSKSKDGSEDKNSQKKDGESGEKTGDQAGNEEGGDPTGEKGKGDQGESRSGDSQNQSGEPNPNDPSSEQSSQNGNDPNGQPGSESDPSASDESGSQADSGNRLSEDASTGEVMEEILRHREQTQREKGNSANSDQNNELNSDATQNNEPGDGNDGGSEEKSDSKSAGAAGDEKSEKKSNQPEKGTDGKKKGSDGSKSGPEEKGDKKSGSKKGEQNPDDPGSGQSGDKSQNSDKSEKSKGDSKDGGESKKGGNRKQASNKGSQGQKKSDDSSSGSQSQGGDRKKAGEKQSSDGSKGGSQGDKKQNPNSDSQSGSPNGGDKKQADEKGGSPKTDNNGMDRKGSADKKSNNSGQQKNSAGQSGKSEDDSQEQKGSEGGGSGESKKDEEGDSKKDSKGGSGGGSEEKDDQKKDQSGGGGGDQQKSQQGGGGDDKKSSGDKSGGKKGSSGKSGEGQKSGDGGKKGGSGGESKGSTEQGDKAGKQGGQNSKGKSDSKGNPSGQKSDGEGQKSEGGDKSGSKSGSGKKGKGEKAGSPQKGDGQGKGQPSDSNQQGDGSPNSQGPSGTKSGNGSNTTGGQSQGNNNTTPPNGEDTQADEANMEYTKKATDLALEHLEDQLIDPDPKLLDNLNMSEEQLRDFVDRWKKLKASAAKDENSRKAYENALKSLDLGAPDVRNRRFDGKTDKGAGYTEDGSIVNPPPAFVERFNAFNKERQKAKRRK